MGATVAHSLDARTYDIVTQGIVPNPWSRSLHGDGRSGQEDQTLTSAESCKVQSVCIPTSFALQSEKKKGKKCASLSASDTAEPGLYNKPTLSYCLECGKPHEAKSTLQIGRRVAGRKIQNNAEGNFSFP